MVVFLLKFIFFIITTVSNVITRLIFSFTAHLLLLFIYAFKLPGQAIQGALEQLADAIRACFAYLLELIMEAISSLISSAVDVVKDAIVDSVLNTGSTIGGLVDKTKGSLDGLLESFPEIIEGVSEMISTIVTDLLKNYADALGYVTENA